MPAKKSATPAGKTRKQKGRTNASNPLAPSPSKPNVPQVLRTEANRPVTANGNMNKHRGDRRDTSKTYTGNRPHSSRGNNARRDVSTRAR